MAYCRARGGEPVVYRDVQSGASATRPGLAATLEAAHRQEVAAVVCVKLDRLGRRLSHFAALFHELQSLGVGLVCISQGIDTVTEPGKPLSPAAHFFITILAAVAEFERALIRERTSLDVNGDNLVLWGRSTAPISTNFFDISLIAGGVLLLRSVRIRL